MNGLTIHPLRARFARALDERWLSFCGQHQDGDPRTGPLHLGDHVQAVHARHVHIAQRYVEVSDRAKLLQPIYAIDGLDDLVSRWRPAPASPAGESFPNRR